MDTGALRRAYNVLLVEVAAGGFRPPPPDRWAAEQIVAHLAVNDELLSATTSALLDGDPGAYRHGDAVEPARLDALIARHGDLAGLAVRLRSTSEQLCRLAERLTDQIGTPVPVHLPVGDDTSVDRPLPWGEVLDLQARVHLPTHADELRALRRPRR